jgi:hypothetical protein
VTEQKVGKREKTDLNGISAPLPADRKIPTMSPVNYRSFRTVFQEIILDGRKIPTLSIAPEVTTIYCTFRVLLYPPELYTSSTTGQVFGAI